MKVKVLKRFKDIPESKKQGKDVYREENEIFTVSEARMKEINTGWKDQNSQPVQLVEKVEEDKPAASKQTKAKAPEKKTTKAGGKEESEG